MPATRQTNTMGEFYGKMLRLIADAKAEPDADLEALIDLETKVLEHVHAPAELGQAQALGGGGGLPAGPMPGGPMGGGGPMPVSLPGPPPGTPAGGGFGPPGMGMMTSPDEMRRMLS